MPYIFHHSASLVPLAHLNVNTPVIYDNSEHLYRDCTDHELFSEAKKVIETSIFDMCSSTRFAHWKGNQRTLQYNLAYNVVCTAKPEIKLFDSSHIDMPSL